MGRVIRKDRKTPIPSISGSNYVGGYYDAYRRKRDPSPDELVREYKQIIYTCSNLNANACMQVPRKLYLASSSNSRPTILRKGYELKSVPTSKIDELCSRSNLQKTLRSVINIEEVVVHPSITKLDEANEIPEINGYELLLWTYLYLDVTGKSYWVIERDVFGKPKNIFLLPTQYVEAVKEDDTKNKRRPVDYYAYQPPGVDSEIKYRVEDIIIHKMPDLKNPYGNGLSPVSAEFTSASLSNKLMSLEEGILDNRGIPDVILVPDGADAAIGADEAAHMEGRLRAKYAHGRGGGFFVASDQMKALPLNIPVRDLARLEIGDIAKGDLSAAFGIPYALVSRVSHNRQQLEAAEVGHAKHGVFPRIQRMDTVLNDQFLPFYDSSNRLFFASDNPIPEDKTIKLQETVQLVMNGIKTPNEGRKDYDYPPIEGGDELRAINVSPELMRQNKRDDGTAEK